MASAGWTGWRYNLVIAALGVLTAGMAASMARNGPITRTTVPHWLEQPSAPMARRTFPRLALTAPTSQVPLAARPAAWP
jgi:hypothetical protein